MINLTVTIVDVDKTTTQSYHNCTNHLNYRANANLAQRIVKALLLNDVSAYAATINKALKDFNLCAEYTTSIEWHDGYAIYDYKFFTVAYDKMMTKRKLNSLYGINR